MSAYRGGRHPHDEGGSAGDPARASARSSARWRLGGILGGLLAGTAVLGLPTPEGLSYEGHATAAVMVVMVIWWVGLVLPMGITALVPVVAFPLLGIRSFTDAAAPFAHPMLFLILGGFILSAAMQRARVEERLAAVVLQVDEVRAHPGRILAALMGITAVLSTIVSNTATSVMLLPLALALGTACAGSDRSRAAFPLGMCYAANIGGVTTLVGTPPNAVLAGQASDMGMPIGFAAWMLVGVPFALGALPLAWLAVTRTLPLNPAPGWSMAPPPVPRLRAPEALVLAIIGLTMAAWITRAPADLGVLQVPGWQALLPWQGPQLDALVAIAAGFAVMLVPAGDGRDGTLLDWEDLGPAIPWSLLLLLGGGFALADAIHHSGLTAWVASGLTTLGGLPTPLAVGAVALGMTGVTEVTSNTASTQIALPLLAAAAEATDTSPLTWMVPATISASCAFMIPISTAPNAVAVEAGGVRPADMVRAGFALNIGLALWTTALTLLVVPFAFGAPH